MSFKAEKENVCAMFNNIAHEYDFLNHLLSIGIDRIWRKKLVREVSKNNSQKVLDVASGTADLAIALAKYSKAKIVGIDISEGMLEVGKKKISKLGLDKQIVLQVGDSEKINCVDNEFDLVMCGFGVRNFENLQKGLQELFRVLKPNGNIAILEFSHPSIFPVKQLYGFYFKVITPFVASLFSKNKKAYHYLPNSVYHFPDGEDFLSELTTAGFVSPRQKRFTFGIATCYFATKSEM